MSNWTEECDIPHSVEHAQPLQPVWEDERLARRVEANQFTQLPQGHGLSELISAADITPVETEWAWKPYIPKKKLVLISGDPSQGKSFITAALASAISNGSTLLGGGRFERGKALIFNFEDGHNDVTVPRLNKVGANLDNVLILPLGANIDDPLDLIEKEVRLHKPGAAFIDPFQQLMAGADLNSASQTRPRLARLAGLAETEDCIVVLVRHLRKGDADTPIYRGMGSIDITAAARSELMVGATGKDHPLGIQRAIFHVKSNLAQAGDPIGFDIRDDGFHWLENPKVTWEDCFPSRGGRRSNSKEREAADWLMEFLPEGELKPSKKIREAAEQEGFSWSTIMRAKDSLSIKCGRGRDAQWERIESK